MLAPLLLTSLAFMSPGDPVRVTSRLLGEERIVGGEVRWVVLVEYDGEPSALSVADVPQPHTENLRIVGVTRASRRGSPGRQPISVLEIGYLLTPERPGWAQIRPAPLVCGFAGAERVLDIEPVGFHVSLPPQTGTRFLAWGGAGVVLAALAGAWAVRRARRSPGPLAAPPPELDGLPVDALEELARREDIALPDALRRALDEHRYARQPLDPGVVERLREALRDGLAARRKAS